MVSFRGKKKSLGHAQIGLLEGFNSKFQTSISTAFICGVPPAPPGSSHWCENGKCSADRKFIGLNIISLWKQPTFPDMSFPGWRRKVFCLATTSGKRSQPREKRRASESGKAFLPPFLALASFRVPLARDFSRYSDDIYPPTEDLVCGIQYQL